jgi:hypothetical protein
LLITFLGGLGDLSPQTAEAFTHLWEAPISMITRLLAYLYGVMGRNRSNQDDFRESRELTGYLNVTVGNQLVRAGYSESCAGVIRLEVINGNIITL